MPLLPETRKSWQKTLARATHWLLYLLVIGLPIGGSILVSTHGQSVPVYGWSLPPVTAVADNEPLRAAIWAFHAAGGFLVALSVLIHIGGALRQEWLLRDNVLRRMTPFLPTSAEREERRPSPARQHGRREQG